VGVTPVWSSCLVMYTRCLPSSTLPSDPTQRSGCVTGCVTGCWIMSHNFPSTLRSRTCMTVSGASKRDECDGLRNRTCLPLLLGPCLVSGSSNGVSVSEDEEGSPYSLDGSSLFAALGVIVDFTSSQMDMDTSRSSVFKTKATLNYTLVEVSST
jgi:hypothetical protein